MSMLQDPLPNHVVYKGKKVKIHTSFRRVLQSEIILKDKMLSDLERIDLCLRLFLKCWWMPHKKNWKIGMFHVIYHDFVQMGQSKNKKGPKVIDFHQDGDLIFAGFWQAYGIDLCKENLHWWTFLALFQALPSDTRIMEIINIRGKPMPKPSKYNMQERQNLARLKAQFKLEITEDERKQQMNEGWGKVAMALESMAKENEKS